MEIRAGNQKGNCWNRKAFEEYAVTHQDSQVVVACQGCIEGPSGRQCTAYMTGDTNPTSETVAGEPVGVADMPVYSARIIEPEQHRQARLEKEAAERKVVHLPPGWLSEMI